MSDAWNEALSCASAIVLETQRQSCGFPTHIVRMKHEGRRAAVADRTDVDIKSVRLLLGAAAVAAASVVAIATSSVARAEPAGAPGAPAVAALLQGIPQHGTSLGNPGARVTVIEYADVQCVYCARFARETLPTIVTRYVRTGRVRIVFRGLAFLGPDSVKALRWTLAAGRQDRLWNVLELLFVGQGAENSGWVTEARLSAIARSVPRLDLARLRHDRGGTTVTAQLGAAADAARKAGVRGTPFFQAGSSLMTLQTLSLKSFDPEAFSRQLDQLLLR
jgi:protein-disulfide isomerase